jgi:hypothetical protein
MVMSPALKAMMETLQKSVRIYEEKFGENDLTRILQEAAKTTS